MTRRGAGRGKEGGGLSRSTSLAGWLFADLLLVLVVVVLGGQSDPLASSAGGHPSPSASTAPKPRTSPSPTPTGPRSLDRVSLVFTINGADRQNVENQIRSQTRSVARRQAALVLTFGGSQAGEAYAGFVNGLLHDARPSMFPEGTTTRDYLNLSAPSDTAKLEIFFYTSPT